jgi:hypothetical protein
MFSQIQPLSIGQFVTAYLNLKNELDACKSQERRIALQRSLQYIEIDVLNYGQINKVPDALTHFKEQVKAKS